MNNCVNINSQEFKSLKEQFPNTDVKILAAKVSLWQDINGIELFPTKEDILNNESNYINVTRNTTAKRHPVLNVQQVEEITSSLLFIGLHHIDELHSVSSQINYQTIEKQLILQLKNIRDNAELSDDQRKEMILRYQYILDNEYKLLPFWKQKIINHIKDNFKVSKSKIDQEEDDFEEDADGNNAVIGKQSYEESGHIKSTTNIKYIIGTVPDIKEYKDGKIIYNKSEFLGLPKFKDSSTIWNSIINSVNGIVQIKNEQGVIEDITTLMFNKLKSEIKYKPELAYVADRVTKMSDNVKTQFAKTFNQYKGRYIDHVLDVTNPNAPISKITDSNTQSKVNTILNGWQDIFKEKFGELTKDNKIVYNLNTIEDFKYMITNYRDSFNEDIKNKKLSNNTINKLKSTFNFLGINLNEKTIDKIIDDTSVPGLEENVKTLIALKEFNINYFNALRDLFKIPANTELQLSKNIIANNKSFFKNILAETEAYFSKVTGEGSFTGAGGNSIYEMQNHSTLSLRIAEMQMGDLEYLNNLAQNDYSSESVFLKDWLDPIEGETNRKSIYLTPYGNASKVDGKEKDQGDKAADLKPSDTFIFEFNKQLSGYFIGLAEADKSQQTYFKGPKLIETTITNVNGVPMFVNPKNEATSILIGYLSAELKRMRTAWEAMYGDNKIDEKNRVLHYHHDGKGNPGNAFKSFLFPNLPLEDFGLKTKDSDIPGQVLADKITKEALLNNPKIVKYIADNLITLINDNVEAAIDNFLINKEIDPNTKQIKYTNNTINIKFLNDRGYNIDDFSKNNAILSAITDYTVNSIIGNVEQTMLFNLDPALYKVKLIKEEVEVDGKIIEVLKEWIQQDIFGDFKKRIPAVGANGKIPRIYNDANGIPKVRPFYTSATIENIDGIGSSFFATKDDKGNVIFNEESIALIHKHTGESIENIKKLFKPYLDINQTDAQAWITLDTYRERMDAYGEWSNKHEAAYDKIQNKESLTFEDKALLAQPLKTVHVEGKKHVNNLMVLNYNKQSEAVLLPFMTEGTKLDNLRIAMESKGVDHVIVLDGKKVGAIGLTSILDDNGDIKNHKDIEFNTVDLSYRYLFLQQELPPHGIDSRQVGSQAVKNVMAVVTKNEEGMQYINEYHSVITKLSNLGLLSIKNKLGYNDDTKQFEKDENGKSKFYSTIHDEFYNDLSDNHLEALKNEYPLDAIPIKDKLQNKLNALITKTAIKLKQLGGALIQISDLGFTGVEVDLNSKVKDGIIWLKNPMDRLKPMHVDANGTRPAQILMPYEKMMADPRLQKLIKQHYNVESYKELTHLQVREILTPEVLEGFSYRIPNQGASSNDAFEVVGILPPEMGDSMVAFSDITTKTGSDFDIDKAFIILPNYKYDMKIGKITKVHYDPDNETKEGLENRRLELMRFFLMHPDAYMATLSPLDDPWFEKLAKKLHPEIATNKDLQFFNGPVQSFIKQIFDSAKSLVGVIANHMASHSLFLAENISFKNYYIGKGIKVGSNNTDIQKDSVSLTSEKWEAILKADPEMTKQIWDNDLSQDEQNKILECL